MHDGQRHLHATDGRQLLAEDLLDVHHCLPGEREVGEDALAELANVARPQEELVPGRFDPSWCLPQRLTEQPRHPHRKRLLVNLLAEATRL